LIDHLVGDSVSVSDSTNESIIVLSLNTLGVDVECGYDPECNEYKGIDEHHEWNEHNSGDICYIVCCLFHHLTTYFDLLLDTTY
jgi:hypothetical protein